MTGLFQNGRNKVLFFIWRGGFGFFSSFTSSMFLIKLAKNLLAYSKTDGHEEKGIYCWMLKWRHIFYFFTEWKNDLLAAFSMHPTTSTTRTCRGVGGERRGGERRKKGEEEGKGRGGREEGGERESVGKKDKGKLLDKHKHGRALCVCVCGVCLCVCVCGVYDVWNLCVCM